MTPIITWVSLIISALMPIHGFAAEADFVTIVSAATKDQPIPDANVHLQGKTHPNTSATTDSLGRALLDSKSLADSTAQIMILREGYAVFQDNCPCENRTFALSPNQQGQDSIRIVLMWQGKAWNLEGHLRYASAHVYYGKMKSSDASLDVDSYNRTGPVSISINPRRSGETYVYGVYYSGNMRDLTEQTRLTESNAKVFVYTGSKLTRTFEVPKNQKGNLWTVFRLTEQGAIEDINQFKMTNIDTADLLEDTLQEGLIAQSIIDVSDEQREQAKQLNSQGDKAYRAGNTSKAIQLYEQAIKLDPRDGQAYSNLGIAYQKSGKLAESISANRRAIALARGPSTGLIRAGSYYNVGRLYENSGQFENAEENYRAAWRENNRNIVYYDAIIRVRKQLLALGKKVF
ncbi:hypothetical protein H681_03790 [Pseudomonas sp. ATCC 13867]|uniref:tetratricopeptide repeat protein n=1 Tax=Pseudomonas sp. ATCC 13867 TaxID=1294143 RepID=UPI0002C4F369|nr:tetratricopeptide repeat protein [Pseudomonas sp. ATCC 13867]AGI22640.1 hypothetical protein H681_03790 [Pseudomonas sp. ATCC 13867]RFQ25323.1 tetratricopeptide repeat protein [Pseudomonas sp. ATCC 13867]